MDPLFILIPLWLRFASAPSILLRLQLEKLTLGEGPLERIRGKKIPTWIHRKERGNLTWKMSLSAAHSWEFSVLCSSWRTSCEHTNPHTPRLDPSPPPPRRIIDKPAMLEFEDHIILPCDTKGVRAFASVCGMLRANPLVSKRLSRLDNDQLLSPNHWPGPSGRFPRIQSANLYFHACGITRKFFIHHTLLLR